MDFTTPSNSKFTGPIAIAVTPFTEACAATGTCIPQPGVSDRLDSLGDRLMFRLAYRKFATHESLVINHAAKTSVAASGVRWYEIRSPNTTPVVLLSARHFNQRQHFLVDGEAARPSISYRM